MWEYILNSLFWSGVGLILGYLLGRMEREMRGRNHDDDHT